MVSPTSAKTFAEYAIKHLIPFLNDLGGKSLHTKCESILCNWPYDVSGLQPCNHSEADTRIFLHLKHAVAHGYQRLSLQYTSFPHLVSQSCVWTSGTGKKICDILIHDIYSSLGPTKSLESGNMSASGNSRLQGMGVSGCHIGWLLKMLVKPAPSFCIVVVKNHVLRTVNTVELESTAHHKCEGGCVNSNE